MKIRRIALAVFAAVSFSGCASLNQALSDAAPEREAPPSARAPRLTPEQAYDAGVFYSERGDYDAARREWDRCVAMSPPDSGSRVDCMVALERLPTPSPVAFEP